jgi:uncharacterized protein
MSLALTDQLNGSVPLEGELSQEVPCAAFPRLVELLLDREAKLSVEIRVRRSSSGIPLITGRVAGRVEQQCQRCLEPVTGQLEVDLRLAVVVPENEELVPADFEPWQADAADVTLGELIEDELLLALPMVARHSDDRCGELAARLTGDRDDADDAESEERDNPFAVLRALKKD